jgi:pilus assembly protein CpaC
VSALSRIPISYLGALSLAVCVGPVAQLCAQAPTPASPAAAVAGQDAANDLSVTVGKSALVDFAKPVIRVAIGLGDIAEASVVSPHEILVDGKAAGDTTMIVWEQGGGRQFFNLAVHSSHFVSDDSLSGLRRELRASLPGQTLTMSSDKDLIFLRGTVKDLDSANRAVQIASTAGKVVNLLYVEAPPPPRQILLKVRFASVDRTFTKQLGLNLFSTGAANTIGSISTGQFTPPTVSLPTAATSSSAATSAAATVSNALNLFFFRPDLNLGATIEAMESQGLAQVLAEPNLLAENGKQASFLAGGQFPFPVVQGTSGGVSGAVTIQFKEFGVRLNFIPTIMPDGKIRLQVAPEVSSLDFANGITISGFTVPAIDVRRVTTQVQLNPGQSFAIGGLLDNRETETLQKVPYLSNIPVLGKLFQSIQKTKNNTELLVIVTPEIVEPIKAGEIPSLNYPAKFLPPNSKVPMSNPVADSTNSNPIAAAPITVEALIKSMQPETKLNIDSTSSSSSGGSSSISGPTQ